MNVLTVIKNFLINKYKNNIADAESTTFSVNLNLNVASKNYS